MGSGNARQAAIGKSLADCRAAYTGVK
jgi:hypothetical protein